MSPMRHPDDGILVRSYAVTHPGGTVVPPQAPGWDELLYAASGAMAVVTDAGRWVVPPHRAVWVPAGVDRSIEVLGAARLRNLYLRAGLAAPAPGTRVVDVPPLVRELLLHAVRLAPLRRGDERHEHLAGLLARELEVLPAEPLRLPMPRDARARAVADAVLADLAGPDRFGTMARSAGASRRTIERLFAAETGMSPARWRARARIVVAVGMLARGQPVSRVAAGVGYASPSAFVAAFRRELGEAPGRWFAARR